MLSSLRVKGSSTQDVISYRGGEWSGLESHIGNLVLRPESGTRHFCLHLLTSHMALPNWKGAGKYNPPMYLKREETWMQTNNGNF